MHIWFFVLTKIILFFVCDHATIDFMQQLIDDIHWLNFLLFYYSFHPKIVNSVFLSEMLVLNDIIFNQDDVPNLIENEFLQELNAVDVSCDTRQTMTPLVTWLLVCHIETL